MQVCIFQIRLEDNAAGYGKVQKVLLFLSGQHSRQNPLFISERVNGIGDGNFNRLIADCDDSDEKSQQS